MEKWNAKNIIGLNFTQHKQLYTINSHPDSDKVTLNWYKDTNKYGTGTNTTTIDHVCAMLNSNTWEAITEPIVSIDNYSIWN